MSRRRVALLSALLGGGLGAPVLLLGTSLMGQAAVPLGLALGAGTVYLVATEPKRALQRSGVLEAAESPALAAAAAVYLTTSASVSKTLLSLRSHEPTLRSALWDARRRLLLGSDPALVADEVERRVPSESAARVVQAVGRSQPGRLDDGGEELDRVMGASALSEETKTPLLLAASFFVPIMSLLFAAISRAESIAALGGLAVLDTVVLDLVMSFSMSERVRTRA